jgi:hypothetical protein
MSGATLPSGLTLLLRAEDDPAIGITFGVYRLTAGQRIDVDPNHETALLALSGAGALLAPQIEVAFDRKSFVTEGPTVLHAASGTPLAIHARGACEVALIQTKNDARFATRTFDPWIRPIASCAPSSIEPMRPRRPSSSWARS